MMKLLKLGLGCFKKSSKNSGVVAPQEIKNSNNDAKNYLLVFMIFDYYLLK